MINKVLFFVLIILVQTVYSQRWDVLIGNQDRADIVHNLEKTYDKGYILVAGFEQDYGWNIKTDINGSVLWDKSYENNIGVFNTARTTDSSGNSYLCGLFWTSETNCWPYISKFDSCGNKVWCKLIIDNNKFYGWSVDVKLNKNNEILVLAEFESELQVDQIFLICLNTYGDVLWTRPYASKNDYPQIGIASSKELSIIDSEFFITGYCYWPFPNNPAHKFLRPMIVKIDSLFNEEWMIPFGVSDSLYGLARDMINLNDTLFAAAGYAYKGNLIVPLLAYFDQNGNEIGFTKLSNDSLGTGFTDAGIDVIEKINDSLFIVLADWGNQNEWYGGKFVTDTLGNISNVMQNTYEAGRKEILRTGENEYLVASDMKEGRLDWNVLLYKMDSDFNSLPYDTGSYTYDSLCPYQITSDTIDLSDCLVVVDTKEVPTPEQYYASLDLIPVTAAPNPATEGVVFSLQNTKHHNNMQLICYDPFGRKILEQKIYPGQLEAHVDVSTWKSGMYVAVVKSEGKVVGKEKFVVRS